MLSEGVGTEASMSLAEKVARDFERPELVEPTEKFVIPGASVQVFGSLRLGERFTNDKVLRVKTEAAVSSEGQVDRYKWLADCPRKGPTHISVSCQKGQKGAHDPTPNQDNFFVTYVGSVGIFGVTDGHGPFGHLVSLRLVQTLPHFLIQNPNFGSDWKTALSEAFAAAHRELIDFCVLNDINTDASGAAGNLVVVEGTSIHVAHIGDAGVLAASYNRKDSHLLHGTEDHKPGNPAEKQRLEAAGSEVRQVDEESYRIYVPGTNFPGLTMSRAFGDTACAGVYQEPEYKLLIIEPTDEVYIVLASDGLWEFLKYEKVLDISAKKLRLKGATETVNYLTETSRKHWAHACGDYCDDITVLLVQLNAGEASEEANHLLTVRRHE